MSDIRTVPAETAADREWLTGLWRREWSGEVMVTRGTLHRLEDLAAILAKDGEERVGAVTYRIAGGECELTSLNALISRRGIGATLLKAVERAAGAAGCRRIWLITTNDNVDALRFYQRHGYYLARLYPGAIAESRRLKPSIPQLGDHDIPIRDEIELEKILN